MLGASVSASLAAGKTIAVSWKTFQEERWKTDEAAIKAAVEAAGNTYISTDAQGSAQKQAADIEGLIAQKPDVVLVVAFDSDAILPSIKALSDAGIKSIAYDVQFEDPNALYITFDNLGVGRIIAQEVQKALSPLAKGAAVLFTIPEEEYTFSRSLAAPMCLVQTIATATAAKLHVKSADDVRIPSVTEIARDTSARFAPSAKSKKAR